MFAFGSVGVRRVQSCDVTTADACDACGVYMVVAVLWRARGSRVGIPRRGAVASKRRRATALVGSARTAYGRSASFVVACGCGLLCRVACRARVRRADVTVWTGHDVSCMCSRFRFREKVRELITRTHARTRVTRRGPFAFYPLSSEFGRPGVAVPPRPRACPETP